MKTLALLFCVACSPALAEEHPQSVPPPTPAPPQVTTAAEHHARAQALATMGVEEQRALVAQKVKEAQQLPVILEEANVFRNKQACEDTRAERAKQVQVAAQEWFDFMKRVFPHAKAINAACKDVANTQTQTVVRPNGGGSYAVRTEPVGGAVRKCGALPKGITGEEVNRLLDEVQSEGYLDASVYAGSSKFCAESDKNLGLDTFVKRNDVQGIQRVIAWKP